MASIVNAGARTVSKKSTHANKRLILLFKQTDLRIHDNLVLKKALSLSQPILPLFCFDPRFLGKTKRGEERMSLKRFNFLLESVVDLRANLQEQFGLGLYLSVGKTEDVILKLLSQPNSMNNNNNNGQHAMFTTVLTSMEPYSEELQIDNSIGSYLHKSNTGMLESIWHKTLYHPGDLPPGAKPEAINLKFTPWRQKVENNRTPIQEVWIPSNQTKAKTWKQEWLADSDGFNFLPNPIQDLGFEHKVNGATKMKKDDPGSSAGVMEDSIHKRFIGGETIALQRLKDWIWDQDHLRLYKETRNGMLGQAYSSKFSPWLATGCLSPRMIYAQVQKYEKERAKNKSTYWLIFELMWRDFFTFQAVRQGNNIFKIHGPIGANDKFYQRNWPGSNTTLEKWKQGQTGWPLVDANMRELNATGFMSNRGRQNVASFLALEQRVDWRKGARYFEKHLLDHDVGSNYGNWCAAAGLFGGRINRFNILKQSKDYDKYGEYIKRWIPELSKVPVSKIHAPWQMSKDEMNRSGCVIGKDYPKPLESIFKWPNTSDKDNTHYSKSKKNKNKNSNNKFKQKKFSRNGKKQHGKIAHLY